METNYVCPIHNEIILFEEEAFDLLIRVDELPVLCIKCLKYYYKHECIEQSKKKEEK